jgi:glycosyltransferase involved in cell wall biosynthesis
MVPVKGLDVLLAACSTLRQRQVDFRLYLVGDGPLREPLQRDCRALGLKGMVTFVGTLLSDELADWYRAADFTVLPSRSEGIPNVLRESLACGTPFVASDVGGIPELADGSDSILVAPGDPRSLAEAIEQGLAKWGSRAPKAPPRFLSWPESAASLTRIIESATAGCVPDGLHHGGGSRVSEVVAARSTRAAAADLRS